MMLVSGQARLGRHWGVRNTWLSSACIPVSKRRWLHARQRALRSDVSLGQCRIHTSASVWVPTTGAILARRAGVGPTAYFIGLPGYLAVRCVRGIPMAVSCAPARPLQLITPRRQRAHEQLACSAVVALGAHPCMPPTAAESAASNALLVLTVGQGCCRKVHGRYKELLQVQGVKVSLLKAAHGIDQQRAVAVRTLPGPPELPVGGHSFHVSQRHL